MKQELFTVLPPFAPDYSGYCNILFGLNGLSVILDAGGCTGNYTGYDEPRWYDYPQPLFSAELREIDAVYGDDDRFIAKIRDVVQYYSASFIVILSSPAPLVIGTDFNALTMELETELGLPVFFYDSSGINYYDHGEAEAQLTIAKHFVHPPEKRQSDSVNILGVSPSNPSGWFGNDLMLKELLENCGMKVLTSWGSGRDTLETLSRASETSFNLVTSVGALPAARYMKAKWGIPYLVDFPIGNGFANRLKTFLDGEKKEKRVSGPVLKKSRKARVLVIGEHVWGRGIKRYLENEGYQDICFASFFHLDEELQEENDIRLRGEMHLHKLAADFDIVIGDTLYQSLCKQATTYVPYPHLALSGRLNWQFDKCLIGEQGERYLDHYLR